MVKGLCLLNGKTTLNPPEESIELQEIPTGIVGVRSAGEMRDEVV